MPKGGTRLIEPKSTECRAAKIAILAAYSNRVVSHLPCYTASVECGQGSILGVLGVGARVAGNGLPAISGVFSPGDD